MEDKQLERFEKYKKWIMALVFAVILIVIYKTFDNLHKIFDSIAVIFKALKPFTIGFIMAYILNMPCKKISAKLRSTKYNFLQKNSKAISILSIYLIGFLLVYILFRLVVPELYKNVIDLYYNIPNYFDDVISGIVKWQNENNIILFEVDKISATDTFNKLLSKIDISEFSKYAEGVVSITSGVINGFIGIIVSVYMLIDKEKIIESSKRLCRRFFKSEKSEKIISIVGKINQIFSKYIFCLLLDAFIVAVLSSVILTVLGVKYAPVLGLMMGICNLIPYFGAIISSICSIVITLITGGLFKAIWTAVALLILQQVDGNYISPKIMGQMLNVSPLWIIFAVTIGGGVFGVAGMILSVPIMMVIKMIASEVIRNRETEHQKENKNV